jgi:hypothetical protein
MTMVPYYGTDTDDTVRCEFLSVKRQLEMRLTTTTFEVPHSA